MRLKVDFGGRGKKGRLVAETDAANVCKKRLRRLLDHTMSVQIPGWRMQAPGAFQSSRVIRTFQPWGHCFCTTARGTGKMLG